MNSFEVNKATKVVITIFIGFAFLLVVVMVLWSMFKAPKGKDIILKNAIVETFHGNVDSIYRDSRNHNAEMLILSDGTLYGVYADWESSIDLNDSLSKSKGSYVIKVYKKNGQKMMLDYRQLVKNWH